MKGIHIHFDRFDVQNLPNHRGHNTNKIAYSSFHQIEDKGKVGGIAIKYVSQGLEKYTIGNETFEVENDHFLLLNQDTDFSVSIDTQTPTNGLCVNLDTRMVQDVLDNYEKTELEILDNPFNNTINFLIVDKIYSLQEAKKLGASLKKYANEIEAKTTEDCQLYTHEDLFYSLTKQLLQCQNQVRKQMQNLSCVKQSTRKELYKRLSVAKEYIDENLEKSIDIQEISRVATISPFHFHRTFKAVYGLSPHQYRIQKRLGKAAELLLDIDHSITEIAFLTGFADIHSFSRSFKKEFGIPPSKYRRRF